MDPELEIRHYVDRRGRDIFGRWLASLGDTRARAKIAVRLNRLAARKFGDCKAIGQGLFELRVDWGPGYRVYFARIGELLILLLCGGDKRKQTRDIEYARA